jgi:WD40 repeat protein
VAVWNTNTPEKPARILALDSSHGVVMGLACSPDRRLVACSQSSQLQLFETTDFSVVFTSSNKADEPTEKPDYAGLQFSLDSMSLAMGNRSTVEIWSVRLDSVLLDDSAANVQTEARHGRALSVNAKRDWVLRGHEDDVVATAFGVTATGRALLATASADSSARVWDVGGLAVCEDKGGNAACLAVLTAHRDSVRDVCFVLPSAAQKSPLLMTASSDGSACVWAQQGTGSWATQAVLRGHSSDIRRVRAVPPRQPAATAASHGDTIGVTAVTASDDGTVKVWSLENAHRAAVPPGHPEAITACVWCRRDGADVVVSADKLGGVSCFAHMCTTESQLWRTTVPTVSPSCKAVVALAACGMAREAIACAMYKQVVLLSSSDGSITARLKTEEWVNDCAAAAVSASAHYRVVVAGGDGGFL